MQKAERTRLTKAESMTEVEKNNLKKEVFAPVKKEDAAGPSPEDQSKKLLDDLFSSTTAIGLILGKLEKMFNMHPLLIVSSLGHEVGLSRVLSTKVEINYANPLDGNTAIHLATKAGHVEIVKKLHSAGADLSKCNKDEYNPFMIAVESGIPATVNYLWQYRKSFNLNRGNKNGHTALILAANRSWESCVSLLLSGGVAKNFMAHDGKTALIIAAMRGDQIICQKLVDNGANILAEDNSESTAICVSVKENKDELATYLMDKLDDDQQNEYIKRRFQLLSILPDSEETDQFFEDTLYPVIRFLVRHEGTAGIIHYHGLVSAWIPVIHRHLENETVTDKAFHFLAEALCGFTFFDKLDTAVTADGSSVTNGINEEFTNEFIRADGPELCLTALSFYKETNSPELVASSLLPLLPLPKVSSGYKWLQSYYYKISGYLDTFEKEKKDLDYVDDMEEKVTKLWIDFRKTVQEIQAVQADIHGAELVEREEKEKVMKEKKRERRRLRRQQQRAARITADQKDGDDKQGAEDDDPEEGTQEDVASKDNTAEKVVTPRSARKSPRKEKKDKDAVTEDSPSALACDAIPDVLKETTCTFEKVLTKKKKRKLKKKQAEKEDTQMVGPGQTNSPLVVTSERDISPKGQPGVKKGKSRVRTYSQSNCLLETSDHQGACAAVGRQISPQKVLVPSIPQEEIKFNGEYVSDRLVTSPKSFQEYGITFGDVSPQSQSPEAHQVSPPGGVSSMVQPANHLEFLYDPDLDVKAAVMSAPPPPPPLDISEFPPIAATVEMDTTCNVKYASIWDVNDSPPKAPSPDLDKGMTAAADEEFPDINQACSPDAEKRLSAGTKSPDNSPGDGDSPLEKKGKKKKKGKSRKRTSVSLADFLEPENKPDEPNGDEIPGPDSDFWKSVNPAIEMVKQVEVAGVMGSESAQWVEQHEHAPTHQHADVPTFPSESPEPRADYTDTSGAGPAEADKQGVTGSPGADLPDAPAGWFVPTYYPGMYPLPLYIDDLTRALIRAKRILTDGAAVLNVHVELFDRNLAKPLMVQWVRSILAALSGEEDPDQYNNIYCLLLDSYLARINHVDWNQLPPPRCASSISLDMDMVLLYQMIPLTMKFAPAEYRALLHIYGIDILPLSEVPRDQVTTGSRVTVENNQQAPLDVALLEEEASDATSSNDVTIPDNAGVNETCVATDQDGVIERDVSAPIVSSGHTTDPAQPSPEPAFSSPLFFPGLNDVPPSQLLELEREIESELINAELLELETLSQTSRSPVAAQLMEGEMGSSLVTAQTLEAEIDSSPVAAQLMEGEIDSSPVAAQLKEGEIDSSPVAAQLMEGEADSFLGTAQLMETLADTNSSPVAKLLLEMRTWEQETDISPVTAETSSPFVTARQLEKKIIAQNISLLITAADTATKSRSSTDGLTHPWRPGYVYTKVVCVDEELGITHEDLPSIPPDTTDDSEEEVKPIHVTPGCIPSDDAEEGRSNESRGECDDSRAQEELDYWRNRLDYRIRQHELMTRFNNAHYDEVLPIEDTSPVKAELVDLGLNGRRECDDSRVKVKEECLTLNNQDIGHLEHVDEACPVEETTPVKSELVDLDLLRSPLEGSPEFLRMEHDPDALYDKPDHDYIQGTILKKKWLRRRGFFSRTSALDSMIELQKERARRDARREIYGYNRPAHDHVAGVYRASGDAADEPAPQTEDDSAGDCHYWLPADIAEMAGERPTNMAAGDDVTNVPHVQSGKIMTTTTTSSTQTCLPTAEKQKQNEGVTSVTAVKETVQSRTPKKKSGKTKDKKMQNNSSEDSVPDGKWRSLPAAADGGESERDRIRKTEVLFPYCVSDAIMTASKSHETPMPDSSKWRAKLDTYKKPRVCIYVGRIQFPNRDFIDDLLIGLGTRGEVCVGLLDGHEVAVRRVDRKRIRNNENALLRLPKIPNQHNNICKYLAAEVDPDFLYIASELCEMNLSYYMSHVHSKKINTESLVRQLVEGVAFLHHQKIFHSRLQVDNILIGSNGVLKISDYGFGNRKEGQLGSKDKALDLQGVGRLIVYILTEGRCNGSTVKRSVVESDPKLSLEANHMISYIFMYKPRSVKFLQSHPYFWPVSRRLDLLLYLQTQKSEDTKVSDFLLSLEEKKNKCLPPKGWKSVVDPLVFGEMETTQMTVYEDTILDLLSLIFDTRETWMDRSRKFQRIVLDVASYFFTLFPRLFTFVYVKVRNMDANHDTTILQNFVRYLMEKEDDL